MRRRDLNVLVSNFSKNDIKATLANAMKSSETLDSGWKKYFADSVLRVIAPEQKDLSGLKEKDRKNIDLSQEDQVLLAQKLQTAAARLDSKKELHTSLGEPEQLSFAATIKVLLAAKIPVNFHKKIERLFYDQIEKKDRSHENIKKMQYIILKAIQVVGRGERPFNQTIQNIFLSLMQFEPNENYQEFIGDLIRDIDNKSALEKIAGAVQSHP